MSGGTFDYKQYELQSIADAIEQEIINNAKTDRNEFDFPYSEKTIKVFQQTIRDLHQVLVYVHRIDWLVSGDDGEETFHKRIEEDLIELRKKEFNK